MKTFVKNYIGKGKQIAGLEIVKITCKLEDLQKFAYDYDGTEYVTFEIAKMKNPDSFSRTHTAYVSQKEEAEVNEPKPEKKTAKPKKKLNRAEVFDAGDDLPF